MSLVFAIIPEITDQVKCRVW